MSLLSRLPGLERLSKRSRSGDGSTSQRPHALLVVENETVPHDRRVWNQARSAQRNGYDVTVICPQGRKKQPRRETIEGVDIVRFSMPFGGPRKIDFVLEYGWALFNCFQLSARVWRKQRFDLIHVANPPDLFFPLQWVFGRMGAAFVFDQHDLGPETYQSKFDEEQLTPMAKLLGRMEALSYKAADSVIVTNESYRERALGRGRMADDDVFIVRNSPDLELFKPRTPKPELKAGYEHMVVFVGTMGYQDGVHVLLEAAKHVRDTRGRTDVLFVLMGTGDTYDALLEQHEALGLGEGVRFTGFIPDDDMIDYLSSADVGAAPDDDNPLNNISTMIKTMDYMAMGLPVVSFDLVESKFSAGPAAVYASTHSPEAFGDAIIELCDDDARRAQMGRAGRERIEGPLSWAQSEKQLMASYDRARENASR